MTTGTEEAGEAGRLVRCCTAARRAVTFLASHIGLLALVRRAITIHSQ